MRFPLPDSDEALTLTPRWGDADHPLQFALLVLAPLLLAALLLYLFRWEARLVRRRAAVFLVTLRLLVIAALWFVACFEPRLISESSETLPNRVLIAIDGSGSMDLPDPQRSPAAALRLARLLKLAPASLSDPVLDRCAEYLEKGGSPSDFSYLTEAETERPAPEQAALRRERQRDLGALLERMAALRRSAQAARIMDEDGLNLLAALKAAHEVKIISFTDEVLLTGDAGAGKKGAATSAAPATDLRSPLEHALAVSSAKEAAPVGLILLSDGRHNKGEEPLLAARRLGKQGTPILPILLTPREAPPDLALVSVKPPAATPRGMELALEVELRASHLPATELRVEVFKKGAAKPIAEAKPIAHKGNDGPGAKAAVYSIKIPLKIDEPGTHALEVKARTVKDVAELTRLNNELPAVVRIVQDKPRVLLVDGEARWEYHYLAEFLRRADNLDLDRVLFQQPRLGLHPEDKLEKRFARRSLPVLKEKDDPLFAYDCILLGDVDPDDLPLKDRDRLHRYVFERGGTLILISGKRHLPLAYDPRADGKDPLGRLVPVTEIRPITPKDKGFGVKPTETGKLAGWLSLADGRPQSDTAWAELPGHFWGLTGKARPGAVVLAVPTTDESKKTDGDAERGIFVQQNFGLGRVLWLGLESTWRWRYHAEDRYHHRFWGQLVLWAASKDILPAGTTHVRFGSRQPVYAPGQEVDAAVRIGPEVVLSGKEKVSLRVVRLDGDKEAIVEDVALEANPGQPRLFEAKLRGLAPGRYRVEPVVAEHAAKVKEAVADRTGDPTFSILPGLSTEMLDPSGNPDLLQALARESGGKLYTPATINDLLRDLERRVQKKEHRYEKRLWQDEPFVWWLLGGVVALLTIEWLGRKWAGLP
ncbi:MAG: hypothetical protein U0793_17005 [Gemmataceae bacterium]